MEAIYTKEFIYERGTKADRAVSILFKKNSLSYFQYGEFVVVEPVWDDENEIRTNYETGICSFGSIKANILVKDQFSQDQINRMIQNGFNTEDISIADHV